jgi:sugar phosphate isomerase/epimerase
MRRRTFARTLPLAAAAVTASGLSGWRSAYGAHLKHFELGIITDEVHEDVETALEFVSQFGLGWVEIRNVWGQYVTDVGQNTISRLKKLLQIYGLRVSVVDTALFKTTLPGTRPNLGQRDIYPYNQQFDLLNRAVDRAVSLNAPYLRIFDFWRCREQNSIMDAVVEHLRRAIEIARPAGVRLLVENEYSCHTGTGAEMKLLQQRITNPYLGFIWDPQNCLVAGKVPFPDQYDRCDKARIAHVHIKDALKDPVSGEYRSVRVGSGEVDWIGQFGALLRDGYRGTMSLETHYNGPDGTRYSASLESIISIFELIKKA